MWLCAAWSEVGCHGIANAHLLVPFSCSLTLVLPVKLTIDSSFEAILWMVAQYIWIGQVLDASTQPYMTTYRVLLLVASRHGSVTLGLVYEIVD